MGYFTDSFRALGTTLRNMFRPPVTAEFPKVIRPRAERFRASFALLHDEQGDELCIGCLQCERICPAQVIALKGGKRESPVTGKKRGYADDFSLDLSACSFCELCVQVCPEDAIVMTREPEQPAFGREDLVLTKAKLYENEQKKHRAWGTGSKLMEMQTPPKPKPAPAPVQAPAAAPSALAQAVAATAPQAAPAAPAPAPAPEPASAPAISAPGSTAPILEQPRKEGGAA